MHRLRNSDRLEPWVFQIARNAIADHFRKTHPDLLESEVAATSTADDPPPNLNDEVAGCLNKLIEQLPANLQRAVQLYEQEGISQQEIAERESISLSAPSRASSGVENGLRELLDACCQFQFDRRGNILASQPSLPNSLLASKCDCSTCATDPT